jgi:hypothetical protein
MRGMHAGAIQSLEGDAAEILNRRLTGPEQAGTIRGSIAIGSESC